MKELKTALPAVPAGTSPAVAGPVASSRARFEQVKSATMSLTAKQRRELLALLGGIEAQEQKPAERANARLLYEEAASVLLKVTAHHLAPFDVVKARIGKDLAAASDAFDLFLCERHTGKMRLRPAERIACYHYLLEVIVRYMHAASIPLTLRTLLQQALNVGLIVDHAFPGYAQAGLLPVVISKACGLSE